MLSKLTLQQSEDWCPLLPLAISVFLYYYASMTEGGAMVGTCPFSSISHRCGKCSKANLGHMCYGHPYNESYQLRTGGSTWVKIKIHYHGKPGS